MGSREIKGESVISRKGKVIAMKQNKLFKKLWVFMLVLSFLATQFVTVQAAAKTNKETISLNKSVYTLKKGKTVKLKAVLNKAAKRKGVKWSSSNRKVATVSKNGKVTAKRKGKAAITATVKGTSVKARCKITVGTPVSKVTLNRKSLTLKTGQSFSLKTSISPKKASVKKVNYKSSNKRVASVSKKGVIQAVSAGTVKITATAADGSGKRAVCTVKVEEPETANETTKPEETPKPEESTRPNETTEPEETNKPEDTAKPEETGQPGETSKPEETAKPEETNKPEETAKPQGGKLLVAYFSWSGTSERIAKNIITQTGADSFRIERETPYSDDYNTVAYGEAKDEADSNDRPPLKNPLESVAAYDKIVLCYPIWWHTAPMTVGTFLETYDLTGKTIYPISQSASMDVSQYNQSVEFIKECAKGAVVDDGLFTKDNAVIQSYIAETVLPVKQPAEQNPSSVSHIVSYADVPLLSLNNGVQIPQLGLGTQIQRLEGNGASEELNETSRQAVVAALQSGYRHLDTAHGYYNERGVGQGIIDSGVPREEIWLTSKLWPSEYGEGVTMEAIDAMLKRLQVDYLDCIYLHHPVGDYVGAWKDLEKAYRQGKVRALGISNFDNWPEAFHAIVDDMEIKPAILQIECHPFAQRKETRALAAQYGMQIECWYPLGHADERLLKNPVLTEIAAAHGKSVVQVILRWHVQEGFSVIPGSTNPSHIQENIDIFDFSLSEEEMEQIRALDSEDRYFNLPYDQMGSFFPLIGE